MAKRVRISLANKCQLLFGGAVLLILVAALSVGWLRMRTLVREGQESAARRLAEAWLQGQIELGSALVRDEPEQMAPDDKQNLRLQLIDSAGFEAAGQRDEFIGKAIRRMRARGLSEYTDEATDADDQPLLRYVRAIRESDLKRLREQGRPLNTGATQAVRVDDNGGAADDSDPMRMVLVLDLRSDHVQGQLMLNRIFVIAAGLLAGLLAIGTFWFITTRLILSPVRLLRRYAEQVSEGNIKIRSDINTGDEFEQLSDMFNTMLDRLEESHDELTSAEKSLNLKLNELAETNVALYEANKIKGEFLANVSHELRTPLNSIIGFAEVLEGSLPTEEGPPTEKRKRYIRNIITSSRRLLELINDLLDLAKIEAGRMELHVGPVSVADTCEGLVNLMRPQAEKRNIDLVLKARPTIPLVQTDAGRLQQILFNFLSNAVKFTPDGGAVTVSADTVPPMPARRTEGDGFEPTHIRISVKDTGPGIDPKDHDRIFEKFTQLDPSVTKEHGGTGLGLTISRDLARLLNSRIDIDSAVGQGATFSLVIPLEMKPQTVPLMPDLAKSN